MSKTNETIHTSIIVDDDGNITAFELAEKLKSKGYEIKLPNKENEKIEFGDFMYHGKKLIDINFSRNIISMYLEENSVNFTLEFA